MPDDEILQGTVDRASLHYECCFGSGNDSPATWRVVLRFASGTTCFVTYEAADDASTEELEVALRLLRSALVEMVGSVAFRLLPDGGTRLDVDGTMSRIVGSSYNWYGDWHYRRGATLV